MRLEKRKPSGREKNEEAVKLLAKLREQLYSSNISIVRQSAFHLSWMQEDGLEILTEALFGNSPRRTKGAAAYGLRKMRGRMRKRAEEELIEGLKHPDPRTAEICGNALIVLKRGKQSGKSGHSNKGKKNEIPIREVSTKKRKKRTPQEARKAGDRTSRRR